MNGPYKAEREDGCPYVVQAADAKYVCKTVEEAGKLAHVLNLAHHTARGEAIEDAIAAVRRRLPFEMGDSLEYELRALLGAGENKPADAGTSSKEPDRGEE